jgi:hypothetical protein
MLKAVILVAKELTIGAQIAAVILISAFSSLGT